MCSNNEYNSRLKQYARNLRNKSTGTEIVLWKKALRSKKMKGYPFRRQRAIGWYIADFACLPLKLVIELDGITHQEPEVRLKDAQKDKFLRSRGFTVLRFNDEEIWNNLDEVIKRIEACVLELEKERF